MVPTRFVYTAYVFLTDQKFLANPEARARLLLIQRSLTSPCGFSIRRSFMMLGWRFASVSLLAADAEVPWHRIYSYEIFSLFPATNKAGARFYANQRGSVALPLHSYSGRRPLCPSIEGVRERYSFSITLLEGPSLASKSVRDGG